ncbi:single myb histone 6-like isoform X2 [Rutidosis leptorrhynchoides]
MGVRKKNWSLEEEAALRAGIAKHGLGKWSTIVRDTEFASVLHLRSNVDLKDKWRNMGSVASGSRCRRVRSVNSITDPSNNLEAVSLVPKQEPEYEMNTSPVPKTTVSAPLLLENGGSKLPILRLDRLILDTIANLNETHGSSQTAIAKYIEENHLVDPSLNKQLKEELKALLDCGKLKKVRHRYRIIQQGLEKDPPQLLLKPKEEYCLSATKILTKEEIDQELEKMLSMTQQQAAAIAMKAVAEAAVKEAELAAKEAEAAEAEAELAKVFVAAAYRELKKTALCI